MRKRGIGTKKIGLSEKEGDRRNFVNVSSISV